MNILITGGNGYIAKSLHTALKDTYNTTSISRVDFDLTSFSDLHKFFKGKYFDAIIHTAVSGGSRLRVDTNHDMDNNLSMYYNLLQHREHYGKLIHFGSGAEEYAPETPYGISKRIIARSILEQDSFYNIKVFGVFDENELDTRFIKANLKRYINNQPMMIDVHKKMTFFYMKDLITLVKHHIDTRNTALITESYCAYGSDYSLREIANMINELDDYKVPVYVTEDVAEDYRSKFNAGYGLPYVGFKKGLYEVYNKLKQQHAAN
jgi:nucleoside-diphosphate-sugar epimerase